MRVFLRWRSLAAAAFAVAFAWSMLVFPAIAIAQTPEPPAADKEDYESVCSTAKNDARAANTVPYMVGGFCCGVFGFVFAAVSSPAVPADRLAGKSSDYTSAYTRCYQNEARGRNMKAACGGWAIGTAVGLVVEVAILSSSTNNATY